MQTTANYQATNTQVLCYKFTLIENKRPIRELIVKEEIKENRVINRVKKVINLPRDPEPPNPSPIGELRLVA